LTRTNTPAYSFQSFSDEKKSFKELMPEEISWVNGVSRAGVSVIKKSTTLRENKLECFWHHDT